MPRPGYCEHNLTEGFCGICSSQLGSTPRAHLEPTTNYWGATSPQISGASHYVVCGAQGVDGPLIVFETESRAREFVRQAGLHGGTRRLLPAERGA